jgi:hypothetical protein
VTSSSVLGILATIAVASGPPPTPRSLQSVAPPTSTARTAEEKAALQAIALYLSCFEKKDAPCILSNTTREGHITAISRSNSMVTFGWPTYADSVQSMTRWDAVQTLSNVSVDVRTDLAATSSDYFMESLGEVGRCGAISFVLLRREGKWLVHDVVEIDDPAKCPKK